MDQKQLKTAVISAGAVTFILIAFALGMKLAGGGAASEVVAPQIHQESPAASPLAADVAPKDAKPSAELQQAIVDRLIGAETGVQQALNDMNKATTNNKGGYVEKARADLTQAVEHITAAVDYAKQHPEIARIPAPAPTLDISAQVAAGRGGRAGTAPNLRNSLALLQPAVDELQQIPGGDFGGLRGQILVDIKTSADDIAAGYALAAGGRGPTAVAAGPGPLAPPPAPIPVVAALAPTPTPEKYKPLRFAPSPEKGSDLVLAAAQRLPVRFAAINDPNGREILPPFRSFFLNARQPGDALTVDSLQDNGFEYFIRLGTEIIGESDIRSVGNGDFRSASIGTGSNRLPEIDPALAALVADERIKKGSYEARLLAANPPISLYAFWLVSDNGSPELVYPMIVPRGMQARTLMPVADFIKALKSSDVVQRAPAPPANPLPLPAPPVTTGPDTVSTRLAALQASLKSVRDNLEQANVAIKGAGTTSMDKTLADLTETDAAVAAALDYVKAHPDADVLPPRPGSPDFVVVIGLQPAVRDAYPALGVANSALLQAIRQFVSISSTGPVMSDIGGHRDKILRQLTITAADLVSDATQSTGRQVNSGAYIPVFPDVAAGGKLGSISGTVVRINGQPAANAAITFEIRNPSPGAPRLPGSGNMIMIGGGGIAGTISDDQGRFTLHDLPPGDYAINFSMTGARNGQREAAAKTFSLKEGDDATLDAPIQLRNGGGRGG